DVAFLLLSFFILTTKFKPEEAIEVTPPSSVSSKAATDKDAFKVSIDKEGKVFIDMSDEMREDVINELAKERNLKFSPDDIKYFKQATFVGVPLSQLNQFDRLTAEQIKATKLTGIPTDSTNNELQAWISAAVQANQGNKINFYIKGDNAAKYPAFKGVIEAFKKNDIYKYNLVTNAEDVPEGSELYKKNIAEQSK
ncbi:MAG: biopolymer transporter ExbD, partial [Bacteroidota bacterium]|nr:biopolymer transporter ExbD [Bacteroidota bacterium]